MATPTDASGLLAKFANRRAVSSTLPLGKTLLMIEKCGVLLFARNIRRPPLANYTQMHTISKGVFGQLFLNFLILRCTTILRLEWLLRPRIRLEPLESFEKQANRQQSNASKTVSVGKFVGWFVREFG